MLKKVGLAVIGTGMCASQLHLPQIAGIPEAELIAIVGRSSEKAKSLAERFGAKTWCSSLGEVLKREDVHVVDITLPTFLHREVAVEAMKAGKHVLCEKPMALKLEDADLMIDAAERFGVKLMVAHVLRFWPEYAFVKNVAEKGSLGEVLSARSLRIPPTGRPWAEWHRDFDKSGGVLDILMHDIDYLRYLFRQEVSSVYMEAGNFLNKGRTSSDQAFVTMRFEDGKIAESSASWIGCEGHPFTQELDVYGSEASLRYSNSRQPPITVYAEDGITKATPPETDPYREEIRHFVRCIIEKKKPSISPEDSKASLEVGLAALSSVSLRRSVDLPYAK